MSNIHVVLTRADLRLLRTSLKKAGCKCYITDATGTINFMSGGYVVVAVSDDGYSLVVFKGEAA